MTCLQSVRVKINTETVTKEVFCQKAVCSVGGKILEKYL